MIQILGNQLIKAWCEWRSRDGQRDLLSAQCDLEKSNETGYEATHLEWSFWLKTVYDEHYPQDGCRKSCCLDLPVLLNVDKLRNRRGVTHFRYLYPYNMKGLYTQINKTAPRFLQREMFRSIKGGERKGCIPFVKDTGSQPYFSPT